MDDMWPRIPHIFERINELLDNKSLVKCKEASRIMCSIIDNQKSGKYLTGRMVRSYIKNPEEFAKDWEIFFQLLPMEEFIEFGILIKDFYKSVASRFEENWSPMHIAAERGHLDFCKFIAKVSVVEGYNFSPLLFSAQAGHLEVSKFLYEEIEDKNHRTNPDQLSAQHLAAKNGHLEIYTFLHENSNEINPSMKKSITPLHLAAQYGYFDVCKYICDHTVLVSPRRQFDEMAPLSLAVHRGHTKIAKLLVERDPNNIGIHALKLIFMICFVGFLLMYLIIYGDLCINNPFFDTMLLNVCKSFNEPIEFIGKIIAISLCYVLAVLTFLNIVSDVFCNFIFSPKLEY